MVEKHKCEAKSNHRESPDDFQKSPRNEFGYSLCVRANARQKPTRSRAVVKRKRQLFFLKIGLKLIING